MVQREPSFSRGEKAPYRIIVASIPRSGSTYLVRTLAGCKPGETMPDSPFIQSIERWHLTDLTETPAWLFKTHECAPASLPKNFRVIFLFDDPIQCVISTLEKRWDRKHFRNCGVNRSIHKPEMVYEDVLGYEAMFDSWNNATNFPVMMLHYSGLATHRKQIQEFVGFNVKFNTWKHRTLRRYGKENQLKKTYGRLKKKIDEMPVCSVRNISCTTK